MQVRELRKALGMTQASFGRALCFSRVSVIAWERGHYLPSPSALAGMMRLARNAGLSKTLGWPHFRTKLRMHRPSRSNLNRVLGTQSEWRHWSWAQRNAWRAWRVRYGKMLADEAMGRAIIEYKP